MWHLCICLAHFTIVASDQWLCRPCNGYQLIPIGTPSVERRYLFYSQLPTETVAVSFFLFSPLTSFSCAVHCCVRISIFRHRQSSVFVRLLSSAGSMSSRGRCIRQRRSANVFSPGHVASVHYFDPFFFFIIIISVSQRGGQIKKTSPPFGSKLCLIFPLPSLSTDTQHWTATHAHTH